MSTPNRELSRNFFSKNHFQKVGNSYQLLPINFIPASNDKRDFYIVSNICGDYAIIHRNDLISLINGTLIPDTEVYKLLRRKHILYDEETSVTPLLLSAKYRTKANQVANFTGLFMFVVTLRCNHYCPYCQVSRVSEDRKSFDMTEEAALKAVEFTFKTPSPSVKIEFQGGETLLNFPLIKYIVEKSKAENLRWNKNIQFVIATNLSLITENILEFCAKEGILISTSLDGPRDLHDSNRPKQEGNSYDLTIEGINKARQKIGHNNVAALMTTTDKSFGRIKEIIDTYIEMGFNSIFLRPLSPYGDAIKTKSFDKYTIKKWIDFWKEGMEYILEINRRGYPLVETYSSIILTKIYTSQATRFVNLQSPAGIGISGIIFNYDGEVYASDEGRMAAERGIKIFRLGNIINNTYEEIMLSDNLINPLAMSLPESAPMCNDCAFLTYCGADPDYHYATQGDFLGHKSFSGFCERNMEVFRYLISKIEIGDENSKILKSWIH